MNYSKVGETWRDYKVVKDKEGTSKCQDCALKLSCGSYPDQPVCVKEKRKDKTDIHFEKWNKTEE